MDSIDLAPATAMATSACDAYRRPRVLGTPPAISAGWRFAPAAMTVVGGHQNTQIKFPPRMGPPSCSPPV